MAHRVAGGGTASPRARGRLPRLLGWLATMLFVFYGWLLFRAGSLEQVTLLTRALGHWTAPVWWGSHLLNLLVFAAPLVILDWCQSKYGTSGPYLGKPALRTVALGAMLLGILFFWEKDAVQFIYFQF
jgi:hypothetical protein